MTLRPFPRTGGIAMWSISWCIIVSIAKRGTFGRLYTPAIVMRLTRFPAGSILIIWQEVRECGVPQRSVEAGRVDTVEDFPQVVDPPAGLRWILFRVEPGFYWRGISVCSDKAPDYPFKLLFPPILFPPYGWPRSAGHERPVDKRLFDFLGCVGQKWRDPELPRFAGRIDPYLPAPYKPFI
jgi:hypothetical protein